tara:strand:+ start:390 stop:704 length:315 start_codon:yes stop_codon:yes gene_type:complete
MSKLIDKDELYRMVVESKEAPTQEFIDAIGDLCDKIYTRMGADFKKKYDVESMKEHSTETVIKYRTKYLEGKFGDTSKYVVSYLATIIKSDMAGLVHKVKKKKK